MTIKAPHPRGFLLAANPPCHPTLCRFRRNLFADRLASRQANSGLHRIHRYSRGPASTGWPRPAAWPGLFAIHLPHLRRHGLSPIGRIPSLTHVSPERTVRPIPGRGGQAMLDRIVMKVIEMAVVIRFVAYGMFPKPGLPECSGAVR